MVLELLTTENLFTLVMLIFLQAVLGFDNLLYISLESQRVPPESAQYVRRMGIGLAIGLRIVLLFVVTIAIEKFSMSFLTLHFPGLLELELNLHAVIVLIGGVFIIYTAFKEITHMLSIHDVGHANAGPQRSVAVSIAWIVAMNIVFSFDSILSAMALTDVFSVMAIAIVISGVMMMALADTVAEFLKRNRLYEVLGLFILLIVGIMLVTEGGELAHLSIAGFKIHPMEKSTFYFSIAILVVVDLAQGRYQKKLDQERATQH